MWLLFLWYSILSLAIHDATCGHRHLKSPQIGRNDVYDFNVGKTLPEDNNPGYNISNLFDSIEQTSRNGIPVILPGDLSGSLTSLAENPNSLTSGAEEFTNEQGDTIQRSQANVKLVAKVQKIKKGCETYQAAKKLGKKRATKIVAGLSTVGAGVSAIIAGRKKGDWITVLSGSLRIASAVVSLLGPVGTLVGTVLSLLSTVFAFFGGSSQEPPESKEDMIKRVVETAIERSQLNALKDEVAGVVTLYTTLGDSVKHFRTITEVDDNQSLSEAQGGQLYNHAFQELVPFGKLKEAINQYCEAGFLRTPISGEDTESNKDCGPDDFNCNVRRNAKRCATFVRLYVKLSIQRQFLLTDMASVISEVPGLEVMYTNFLHIIIKEQKRDNDFLRFLSDPINYPNRRYAVYYIYDEPEENKLLIAYIRTLKEEIRYLEGFYKAPVIGCRNNMLHGTCRAIESGHRLDRESFKSIFIPHGLIIADIRYFYGTGSQDFKEIDDPHLIGAGVYHRALDMDSIRRCSGEQSPWSNVYGYKFRIIDLADDALNEVRICSSEQEEPSCAVNRGLKYRHCQMFPRPLSTPEITYKLHIPDTRQEHPQFIRHVRQLDNIESVHIPLNYSVTIEDGTSRLTFHGPDDMNDICLKDEWKNSPEIKISKSKYIMYQVKVCNEKYMGNGNEGMCRSVEVPDYGQSNIIDLNDSDQMKKCTMGVVKSIKIPQGIEVVFMKRKQIQLEERNGIKYLVDDDIHGPFVGPITINDFGISDSVLRSYQYMKLYSLIDDSIELCTSVNCFTYSPGNVGNAGDTLHHSKSIRIPRNYKAVIEEGGGTTIYGPKQYATKGRVTAIVVSLKTQQDKDKEQDVIDAINSGHDEI